MSTRSGAIRNGAIDNASGIAQLLAIARALAALPRPPRRTVILLATTGEELGLLGAEAYGRTRCWPIDQIVADINIDQTGMMWPIVDVVADGAERSSLAGPVARAPPLRSGSPCRPIRSPSRDSSCAATRRRSRAPACRR